MDGDRICFRDGGNETDKVDYLNFFPTVGQMESYSVGELITNEVSCFLGYFGLQFDYMFFRS